MLPMNIVVVGAGIGGLTAAALLLQRGHRVRVFEQAAQLSEIGAGIQMSANAVKVLDHLGLRPAFEAQAVRPQAFEFRRFDDGEMLHRLPLGAAHEQRHGAPYFQIHRGDLHAALHQAVRALDANSITLNARALSVEEGAGETTGATVHFDGLPAVTADLVIGADGIKSVVRHLILGDDQPLFTGQVAWRCSVATADIPPELRTDIVSTIWCGPKNHAVMYYLRGGALLNFVGCVEGDWVEESWTERRPWAELDAYYQGWHPKVRAVIERADPQQIYRWALNNRVPSFGWSGQCTTLLGDAVHATLPYMAQGAAMAIEDAAVLARALELPGALHDRLRRYHEHRAPRTARVVRESTEMGELYHIHDAQAMRQAFHDRDIARSRNEWLYPYDPLTVAIA